MVLHSDSSPNGKEIDQYMYLQMSIMGSRGEMPKSQLMRKMRGVIIMETYGDAMKLQIIRKGAELVRCRPLAAFENPAKFTTGSFPSSANPSN